MSTTAVTRPRWRLSSGTVLALGLALLIGLYGSLTGWGADTRWAAALLVAWLSIELAIVDERTYTLPNRLTARLALVGGILAVSIAVTQRSASALGAAAIAMGVAAAYYGLLALPGWVGFGDVKFAVVLSGVVALSAGGLAMYLPVIATLASAARIAYRHVRGRTGRHPHGASVAAAGLIALALSVLSSMG